MPVLAVAPAQLVVARWAPLSVEVFNSTLGISRLEALPLGHIAGHRQNTTTISAIQNHSLFEVLNCHLDLLS